ncbi:MAG: DUF4388 domain-containing protein [Vicinamibacteria bacterium]
MADASPISGLIDPKAFPFLLVDLHRNGATGSLKVDGPSYQKALYFRGGRVLFGSSNDPRDQLGAILIESGKISPEQLEDVSAKMGPGSPLAKVLADTGFVNQRELSEAAQVKVERILSDVLSYDGGSFEFEDGVLPKGAVDLKLSTEKLVLSAVRRISDRNFVLRHLEGLDVTFAPSLEASGRVPELEMDAEDLLEQIDGSATLKEAAARTRLDEFDAAKIACALLFLGVIERSNPHTALVPGAPPPGPFEISDSDGPELDLTATVHAAFKAREPEPPPPIAAPPPLVPPPPAHPPAIVFERPVLVPPPPPSGSDRTRPALSLPDALVPPPPRSVTPVPVAPRFNTPPARDREDKLPLVPPPPAIEGATLRPAARPSKDDLAAVDALLNSHTVEGPMAAFEKNDDASDRWTPDFGVRAPVGAMAHAPRGRGPMLAIVGVAVAAAAGTGAWYFLRTAPGSTTPTATTLRAGPPVTPSTVATASPEASLPSPTATAVPTAAATAVPTIAAPPTTVPAASGPVSLVQARALMRQGQLPQAARGFASTVSSAPAGTLSVQLLVACAPETVQKAVAAVDSPELYILPVSYQGRDCFRLCWGMYPTQARATAGLRALPPYFRAGGASPKIMSIPSLLP